VITSRHAWSYGNVRPAAREAEDGLQSARQLISIPSAHDVASRTDIARRKAAIEGRVRVLTCVACDRPQVR